MRIILESFKKTIQEYKLLKKKDKILIAYSGGVDSTALLALLVELREEWDFEIFLGHFNHRLRQRADEDERFVRQISQEYSFPLFVGSEDARLYARERGHNIEEAGRRLRYDFLKKTALKIGATKIATGHTMSDQAETILMRLMRGSGLRGLVGIFPVVEGTIIRPLIQIEREDIEAYLREKGMPHRIDESNFDRRFLRNRIRLELIPYIRKNFEPRIVPKLGKMASILREEEALLERFGKEKAQKAIIRKENHVSLQLKLLFSLPRALARRVVREFVFEIKGDLRGISFEDIESVLCIGKGKEYYLKKDLILRREEDLVFLKKEALPKKRYEYLWKGENLLEIRELNLKFEGKKTKKRDSLNLVFNDGTCAFLNLGKLRFPLLVRNRRHGDRYQPLGAPGQKKLKEIMRAKGVPLSEREERPVFFSGEEIIWVLGLPVSERFKIQESTTEIFEIKKM